MMNIQTLLFLRNLNRAFISLGSHSSKCNIEHRRHLHCEAGDGGDRDRDLPHRGPGERGDGGDVPPPGGCRVSPKEKELSGWSNPELFEPAVHGMSCFSELFLFRIKFREKGEDPFRFRRKKEFLADFLSSVLQNDALKSALD